MQPFLIMCRTNARLRLDKRRRSFARLRQPALILNSGNIRIAVAITVVGVNHVMLAKPMQGNTARGSSEQAEPQKDRQRRRARPARGRIRLAASRTADVNKEQFTSGERQ